MKTGIVILAAGASTRMGQPKQLLPYQGSTLLRKTVATASSLGGPVVVVLGANAGEVRGQLDDPRVLTAENPCWSEGMGGSVRTGLGVLLAAHPEVAAVIFMVCDQPLITAAVLQDLIDEHSRTGRDIVAAQYSNALGVPALFSSELFPELLTLEGSCGARQIIEKHRERTAEVPFPEAAMDIDTPGDFLTLTQLAIPVPA